MSEGNSVLATGEKIKPLPPKKQPDLKTIREERGLMIEDISLKTRISPTILNAIENGEFHLLPAPVYSKKFIQIYAQAIGIDQEIILAHYQRHVDATQVVPEEVKAVKANITFNHKTLKRCLLYAVPAVAIIATAFIMHDFFQDNETLGIIQHNVTVDERKQVVSKPPPTVREQPLEAPPNVPQAPPAMAVQKETTQSPSNTPLDLLIEATEDTWINITEDNNPPYRMTLKTGDKLNRKAREFFIIDVGNAAGVNITFLGKSLGSPGRRGETAHLRLPQR